MSSERFTNAVQCGIFLVDPRPRKEASIKKAWTSGLVLLFAFAILGGTGVLALDEKDPPEKLVFETKKGNVTFLHAKHVERENDKCETCHPAVFEKDADAPLNYKPHKKAEKAKKSCATCHVKDGKAFESKGNCNTCHEKKKK